MFTVRGQLFVQILRAKRLCNGEKKKEKPNSFVRISIGETVLAETKVQGALFQLNNLNIVFFFVQLQMSLASTCRAILLFVGTWPNI